MQAPGALVLVAVLTLLCGGIAQEASVPHVDDCNFCFDCAVGPKPPPGAAPRHSRPGRGRALRNHHDGGLRGGQQRSLLSEWMGAMRSMLHSMQHPDTELADSGRQLHALIDPRDDFRPDALHASQLQPQWFTAAAFDQVPKSGLPNCTKCWGCNTQLSSLATEAHFLDKTFKNEAGATSSWLFRASTPRTPNGEAVVKIYCMPLPKRPGAKVPTCAPTTILRNMRLLLGLQQLSDECGFEDIIPRIWVERVSAIVPGLGFHVRWFGLWMTIADGISMENFLHRGEPQRLRPNVILSMLQDRLNKTQVIRGAIFDLLTSQCDRHAQNIFITETGQLYLIDNEAALQSNWKNCAVDSILVPGTQKFTIVRLSNQFVVKLVGPEDAPKGVADPQVLFDYRCYLESERMGTDYPPQIRQCLSGVAALTVKQVQTKYGFDEELPALNLHARATDMLSKGHEWTVKYGKPLNSNSKRYRIPPKCCSVEYRDSNYRCAHPWEPKFEVPIGSPFGAGPWNKPRPDPGTYEGGTFDDEEDGGGLGGGAVAA